MHLKVVLPLALDEEFLYSSGELMVQVGNLVMVNFNGRNIIGLVISVGPETSVQYTVKEITSVLPFKLLQASYIEFLFWVARYNFAKIGLVLRSAIIREACDDSVYTLNADKVEDGHRSTPAMRRLLEFFRRNEYLTADDLHEAKIQKRTVQKMLESGLIRRVEGFIESNGSKTSNADLATLEFDLSEEQRQVKDRIFLEKFTAHLLDGITGSGKTMVYLASALEILKREENAQIIIILSEIALTSYIFEKIKSHFAGKIEIIEWHSNMSPSHRARNWRRVVNNKARIVVGARSAIFLPAPNLRMIIVDEEHDQSFKQDQGELTYNARDLAIMRAKLCDIPIILSSATPSLESVYNIEDKGFVHLRLESRFGGAQLPTVRVVDMRAASKVSQHISEELYESLKQNLDSGMQSLLFLNRRGYASLVVCASCGHRIKCPDCVAWLVEHKWNNSLLCHLCGFKRPMIIQCERCASTSLIPFGPGIEKISEEIEELFPKRRVVVMSSDSQLTENLRKIEANEVDIIIGTQIISKGYDFPKLTLLAIIDSDASVCAGDLRSAEKNFHILQQVMGRVGRRKIYPGTAIMQSYSPDGSVVQALKNGDREGFYAEELGTRKAENMPPFSRLIAIVISGLVESEVISQARYMEQTISLIKEVTMFGPCPAPIGVRNNRFRYRILLVTPKSYRIHNILMASFKQLPIRKGVSVQVDVDPLNFL
ncbi:primosomal protein N' [Neorickettsia helminthoeca str. Oregon]|uniref:Replication restart protein PriA n=1 Tax=Neorickettsia helminthoeca str. Oregon TaxID=1286528 RepID=X5HLA5_9RICK|nr:primosomal protein N' [Neorickettsia helminthoeca]AHX11155.1 primosomal protein N' [Neorickettsia helminthoeca str. Oregon]